MEGGSTVTNLSCFILYDADALDKQEQLNAVRTVFPNLLTSRPPNFTKQITKIEINVCPSRQ
jgi:hypothetical protein